MSQLENYFAKYRKNIIGVEQKFASPYGEQKIVYADWTASGRLYEPIERIMLEDFYPLVGNTHTETNITGSSMTLAYHNALHIIKRHVNAGPEDLIISTGSGMTGVVNKFQRILGLKVYEKHRKFINIPEIVSKISPDDTVINEPTSFSVKKTSKKRFAVLWSGSLGSSIAK